MQLLDTNNQHILDDCDLITSKILSTILLIVPIGFSPSLIKFKLNNSHGIQIGF